MILFVTAALLQILLLLFFDTLLLFSWPVVMTKAAVGACNVGDTVDIIANFVAVC